MKEFQYFVPTTLSEAISLASEYGPEAAFLAGGTDLIVQMKRRDKSPSYVINLKRIADLNSISYSQEEGLKIGALVTHNSLNEHPIIHGEFGLLAEAAGTIGTFQIRERGTIGGNVCNGSPAADTIPALMCLGASLNLKSLTEEKLVAVENFFEGPQQTKLAPGEILSKIQIPPLPPRSGGVYLKLGIRRALEIAIVGVAALVTLDKGNNRCLKARISLASVAPTPLRCRSAEDVLNGNVIEPLTIEQAAEAAKDEARPISDLRGSAEYRSEMVRVLTKRALDQAFERALGSVC